MFILFIICRHYERIKFFPRMHVCLYRYIYVLRRDLKNPGTFIMSEVCGICSTRGITNTYLCTPEGAGYARVLRRQSLFSLVVYTPHVLIWDYERVYFFHIFIYVFIYLFNLLLIIIIIYNKKLYNLICFIWGYGA